MSFRRLGNRRKSAFTIMELMTCVIVVAILLVMLMPVYSQLIRRMERARCMGNLRSLHVAAALYVQDHRMWPQVVTKGTDPQTVANAWLSVMEPYGLAQINWVCPTQQKLLQNPDLNDPANARIDYTANPFDRNPMSPMRWAGQPWFIENGDVHGNGPLIIFPTGTFRKPANLWLFCTSKARVTGARLEWISARDSMAAGLVAATLWPVKAAEHFPLTNDRRSVNANVCSAGGDSDGGHGLVRRPVSDGCFPARRCNFHASTPGLPAASS